MISLWWSFTLTVIGVTGLVLVYRSQSLLGPGIGLAVQALWIAYAIATRQWWFLLSAFTYGAANIYGISTRRVKSSGDTMALDDPTETLGAAQKRVRDAHQELMDAQRALVEAAAHADQ
jgi:hypothetical protein